MNLVPARDVELLIVARRGEVIASFAQNTSTQWLKQVNVSVELVVLPEDKTCSRLIELLRQPRKSCLAIMLLSDAQDDGLPAKWAQKATRSCKQVVCTSVHSPLNFGQNDDKLPELRLAWLCAEIGLAKAAAAKSISPPKYYGAA